VAGFGVSASTGALTPLTGSPFDSGNGQPVAYVTDAGGRLFTSNFAAGQVRAFTTASGIPTLAGNPLNSGLSGGVQGVLHPSGLYLVADRVGNQVGVYRISGSGSATTLSAVGSPFPSS